MAETELTKRIKLGLYQYTKSNLLGVYGAFEVVCGSTLGYGKEHVDFMTMDSQNVFRCYEIKVSSSDLRSPAAWSFYGDFNYFVVPDFLLADLQSFLKSFSEIRYGIIVADVHGSSLSFKLVKKPMRQRIGIEQRIANMHNLVRSMSRYTTYWVQQHCF